MKYIYIAISLILIQNIFAVERIKNPCWNTQLSEEKTEICKNICIPESKEKAETICNKEEENIKECLNNFENCTNYSDVITRRDNCETRLVKECLISI